LTDVGVAAALVGIQTPDQMQHHPLRGALFETMIVNEFLKNRCNAGVRDPLYFWRDNIGTEVDLILERGTKIAVVEIKSGITVASDAFGNFQMAKVRCGARHFLRDLPGAGLWRRDPLHTRGGGRHALEPAVILVSSPVRRQLMGSDTHGTTLSLDAELIMVQARKERSAFRGSVPRRRLFSPDCAALHPGAPIGKMRVQGGYWGQTQLIISTAEGGENARVRRSLPGLRYASSGLHTKVRRTQSVIGERAKPEIRS
jgi:Holliday junction resolvase-like predicted endonuclease